MSKGNQENPIINLSSLPIQRVPGKEYTHQTLPVSPSGVPQPVATTLRNGKMSIGYGYGDSMQADSLLTIMEYDDDMGGALRALLMQRRAEGGKGAVGKMSVVNELAEVKAMLEKLIGGK